MTSWASWLLVVALMAATAAVTLAGERHGWRWPRRLPPGPRPVDYELDYPEFARTPDEHTHVRVYSGYRPASPEPDPL